MAKKPSTNLRVSSDPRDFKAISPEERLKIAVEMTNAMGHIALESLRRRYPKISDAELLELARRRFQSGRRTQ